MNCPNTFALTRWEPLDAGHYVRVTSMYAYRAAGHFHTVRPVNRIDILVAVDSESALSVGTLQDCVYLVDSNNYLGSWQEGQSQLHTVCQDGQLLNWSAIGIDPSSEVSISGFSGPSVDSKLCVPRAASIGGESVWSGQVQSQGQFNSFSYTITIALGTKNLTFDAYLKVI